MKWLEVRGKEEDLAHLIEPCRPQKGLSNFLYTMETTVWWGFYMIQLTSLDLSMWYGQGSQEKSIKVYTPFQIVYCQVKVLDGDLY